MCNFHLDVEPVERRHGIVFREYFADALAQLAGPDSPAAHGLIEIQPDSLHVTPRGRLFIRNVCMAFDRYLKPRENGAKPTFSRTV
jgi:oxygen-independent coproporphyrinogen-3 oxidase